MRLLCFVLALGWAAQLPCVAQETAAPPAEIPGEADEFIPTQWAAQLLDLVWSSPNPEARAALYRAAFAAGPVIVPHLEEALKDDRTAEFAAQSLAFIGGEQALQALWKMVSDPRDLNLRRFYYAALAEYDSEDAVRVLLDAVSRADQDDDRSVTEAAILALTLRSDPAIAERLRQVEQKVEDIVLQLTIENAAEVIEVRARLLESPAAQPLGGSVEDAVRRYFLPAFEPPPAAPAPAGARKLPAELAKISVKIDHLTLSPDQNRALARVRFEDAEAIAFYDIVLQKRFGNWTVASVWLGEEREKLTPAPPTAAAAPR
jgi:hypothetical protein